MESWSIGVGAEGVSVGVDVGSLISRNRSLHVIRPDGKPVEETRESKSRN